METHGVGQHHQHEESKYKAIRLFFFKLGSFRVDVIIMGHNSLRGLGPWGYVQF